MLKFLQELFGLEQKNPLIHTVIPTAAPESKQHYHYWIYGTNFDGKIASRGAFVKKGDSVKFFLKGEYQIGKIIGIETKSSLIVLSEKNEELVLPLYKLIPLENSSYKVYKEFSSFKIEQDADENGKYRVYYNEFNCEAIDEKACPEFAIEEIEKNLFYWRKLKIRFVHYYTHPLCMKGTKKVYFDYTGCYKHDVKEKNKHRVDMPALFKTKERALRYINAVKKRLAEREKSVYKNLELRKKYKEEAIIV